MTEVRLVVVGSGSLARSVCGSLAAVATAGVDVTVLARSPAAAAAAAYLTRTRAALIGRPVTARSAQLAPDRLADTLARLAPAAVLVCASYQSPWERGSTPSAWTDLLGRAGFGASLPLQAGLATDVGRALAAVAPATPLLNACFPDAVNPLLAALGVPVLCGIGNAAILAATLQAQLDLPDQRDLTVLANHLHLHRPADPADEALAWVGGQPVADVGDRLAAQRRTEPRKVNQVTGLTAALLLDGLLTGAEVHTNLPGPLGLPGGYPVRLRGSELELRLPPGWDTAAAVGWNQRMADLDGVRVDRDRVVLAPAAAEALAPYLSDHLDTGGGFLVRDTAAVAEALLDLRTRLRAAAPAA